MKLCMTELDIFQKRFLPQTSGKWVKNKVFFNIFQIICSIMNLYIIVWVPAQIPYLGKIFFGDYTKMLSDNQIAGFSN